MRFHADLHVHSRYSRATSRDLDLEHMSSWACRKGVALVGTGDFTHPAWRAELKEKLVPAEPGLFRLRTDIERDVAAQVSPACRAVTRFMLSVEISTIYKKGSRTRKIHHLLYAPDFDTADRIAARLARIGNIASDGRPILGLDSRDLLEITLESGPGAYLVPAHIWTPWFAALGSQSGFDSIAECYGDLADRIFAVETGLSSDPPMNWRVSALDRYRLVSHSDAHSPGKLGREATTFDTDMDYFAIRRALETGDGYVGTLEFFPEEGKYHLDGHRKCGVRLEPHETRAHENRCPACGQPATVGVLHRVEVLADRTESDVTPPATAGEMVNLVSLPEILSELVSSGPSSKAVARSYDRLLATLGAELPILGTVPVEDIARTSSTLLAEAITRLREGRVIRDAGYDGEYGTIRLFEDRELRRLTAGDALFALEGAGREPRARRASNPPVVPAPDMPSSSSRPAQPTRSMFELDAAPAASPMTSATDRILAVLDDDQRRAVEMAEGPVVIVAGPGSGKTRTLTHRIAWLVAERRVEASACLAITFTRRAAGELKARLDALIPEASAHVAVHTFHSLGLTILREHGSVVGLAPDFRVASEEERAAALVERLGLASRRAESLLRAISRLKRTQIEPGADVAEAFAVYHEELAARHWVDFDDLIGLAARALASDSDVAAHYRRRFRSVSVDEFQDVDEPQYRLLALLAPPNGTGSLCVIGDPRQAIYGFRGADASCFDRFTRDYPDAVTVHLTRNYRSTGTIVTASSQVITRPESEQAMDPEVRPIAEIVRDMHERIAIHTVPDERAEAELVVQTVERMIGGRDLLSIDSGRGADAHERALGFADFAVLYRTSAQADALCEAFDRSGFPYQKHSHDALAGQPSARALLQEWESDADGSSGVALAAQLRAASGRLVGRDDGTGAASRELALLRLTTLAEACGDDRARFVDLVTLATEADFRDPRGDRVSLLTLHAAKGLEFAVVFIVGMEDGILPLHWSDLDSAAEAEERRLFYVGMTRAKDRLVLSRAAERFWRGARRKLPASPFLGDIERALVDERRKEADRRTPEEHQLRLL